MEETADQLIEQAWRGHSDRLSGIASLALMGVLDIRRSATRLCQTLEERSAPELPEAKHLLELLVMLELSIAHELDRPKDEARARKALLSLTNVSEGELDRVIDACSRSFRQAHGGSK